MVFTAGGKYQAINVLPGTYQVSAERRGFTPEPIEITVRAGETVTADLTMKDGPDAAANVNGPASVTGYPGAGPIDAFGAGVNRLWLRAFLPPCSGASAGALRF